MGLALNNTAQGIGGSVSSIAPTAGLTTTFANYIIYVVVMYSTNNNASVSSVTSANLTFSRRIRKIQGNTAVEGWYAIATSTLSLEVMTANFSTSVQGAAIIVLGISGADTVNPFDVATVSAGGAGATPTVNITTTNPNDFIIGATADNSGNIPDTAVGFTLIRRGRNVPTNNVSYETEYEVVSSVQTNFAVTTVAGAGFTEWVIIAEAVQLPLATPTERIVARAPVTLIFGSSIIPDNADNRNRTLDSTYMNKEWKDATQTRNAALDPNLFYTMPMFANATDAAKVRNKVLNP